MQSLYLTKSHAAITASNPRTCVVVAYRRLKQLLGWSCSDSADELAKRMLELDDNRTELRKKYYQKLKNALSPILAARFTQVADQIEKIVDLQIDSSLPIIEEAETK